MRVTWTRSRGRNRCLCKTTLFTQRIRGVFVRLGRYVRERAPNEPSLLPHGSDAPWVRFRATSGGKRRPRQSTHGSIERRTAAELKNVRPGCQECSVWTLRRDKVGKVAKSRRGANVYKRSRGSGEAAGRRTNLVLVSSGSHNLREHRGVRGGLVREAQVRVRRRQRAQTPSFPTPASACAHSPLSGG